MTAYHMHNLRSHLCIIQKIPMSTSDSMGSALSSEKSQEDVPQAPGSSEELLLKIEKIFGKWPCSFQLRLYKMQMTGKNIISIAHTGSRKTLTYLMSLVTASDEIIIIIIITAFNVLSEQIEYEALAAGFSAKSVNGENNTEDVFTVCHINIK
jgi:hypothetical protein